MKKKTRIVSKNPQLLTLLKQGCVINFPDGYSFQADTKNNKINTILPLGLKDITVNLNREGLQMAFAAKKQYYKTLNN
jgi:hypothetical protein